MDGACRSPKLSMGADALTLTHTRLLTESMLSVGKKVAGLCTHVYDHYQFPIAESQLSFRRSQFGTIGIAIQ